MNKLIISTLMVVLPLSLMAKKPAKYEEATKTCEAFNNMKHTSNSNDVSLKVGTEYRILQENKGQILILVEGERVAQRWVDEGCFSDMKTQESKTEPKKVEEKKGLSLSSLLKSIQGRGTTQQMHKSTSKQNLLAISWQNAFCQTHQYKRECKNMSSKDFGAFEFVLHGLWPQPRNNQYCNVDKKQVGMDKNKQWHRLNKLDLTSEVRSNLAKLMPGYGSNLHKHEWIKHGTCYGTNASDYYADAMNLLTQVNSSKVGQFFKQNIGKTIRLEEVRKVFDKEFGLGAGKHVTMNCKRGLVTELWLHLGNKGNTLSELFKTGERPSRTCHKGRIDAVGF
jgi:ribonuclease T2